MCIEKRRFLNTSREWVQVLLKSHFFMGSISMRLTEIYSNMVEFSVLTKYT